MNIRETKFTALPLAKLRMTQPFGVNYLGPGLYKAAGLPNDLHNGWDLSSPTGNEVYACADGEVVKEGDVNDKGYGLVARLFTEWVSDERLEIVHGHLLEVVKTGPVKAGELIAKSDNSGFSSAPHLHFGVRIQQYRNGHWNVENYDNGFMGYVDPSPYFPDSIFRVYGKDFNLPVDVRYSGHAFATEAEFYPSNIWFFKTFKRLATTREYNALRFGAWDVRTVIDAAMFPIWSEYTKVEAKVKGLIK
jgi:hypothetical protein